MRKNKLHYDHILMWTRIVVQKWTTSSLSNWALPTLNQWEEKEKNRWRLWETTRKEGKTPADEQTFPAMPLFKPSGNRYQDDTELFCA